MFDIGKLRLAMMEFVWNGTEFSLKQAFNVFVPLEYCDDHQSNGHSASCNAMSLNISALRATDSWLLVFDDLRSRRLVHLEATSR